MLDQRGLARKDLEPMIGSRARVSEVLGGKRALTLAMIRALSSAWSISADLLLGKTVKPKHMARSRVANTKNSLRNVPARSIAHTGKKKA